jgi:hypothetical protein
MPAICLAGQGKLSRGYCSTYFGMKQCVLFFLALALTRSGQSLRVALGKVRPGRASLYPIQHKPVKLPVWPVWSGVIAQVAEWVGLSDFSQDILTNVGGRYTHDS